MDLTNTTTTSFGKPITAPILIPVTHASTPSCINEPFMVNGGIYKVTCLSFGTPHGAVFVEDIDSVDVSSLGFALGTHVLFPKDANIVFLQVMGKDHIKARVWQRNGEQDIFNPESACVAGTVAMMLQKIMTREARITIGDQLTHVKWDRSNGKVYLTQ